MFYFTVIYCVFMMAITPRLTLGMTAEQKAMIHEHFEKVALGCMKDNPISEEDVTNLRAHKAATGPNVPCFLACVMRACGVMNDEGKLQKETALEIAKSVFDDAEELKNIEDYLHSCAHINDESVGDGEKGCERAMLAAKCMKENASKFGIEI